MKLRSLLLLLFLSTHLYGQSDTSKVAFIAYWSIGDSYDFKITKINQQWKADKLTSDNKQEYIAKFTVLDSTDKSYIISWTYKNDLGSTYQIPEKLRNRFAKYEITEIKYKTSEVGDFLEVLNWKEVGEVMSNMIDDLVDVLGEGDKEKREKLKSGMEAVKQVYSSQQGIEQMVLKELHYIHFPMGVEFDITEPVLYDETLPNMFGGEPIKAKTEISFESVDHEEGFCVFKQEMALNPEDTKSLIKEVFSRMKLNDKEMQEALKKAVVEINDHNRYEFYYNPGIPHRIETLRESVIDMNNDKGKRIDKTIIELIYKE